MMLVSDERVSRSSIYRCLKRNGINRLPFEHREKAKKFKEYIPGFLHIDVTYLPKLEGSAAYLFVAIDRATRLMFYKVYDKKTAESTVDFMNEVLSFYPFIITHILTDNGHEFSNLLYRSKKGNKASNPSKLDEICKLNDIDHRLTKPATPKTNGMVERVNGTIKNNTILKKEYVNKDNMVKDLMDFLCNYNLYRRHGSLRRELKVKTPIQALNKWYEINPEIFIRNPNNTENYLLNLQRRNNLKNQ
jgi:transposase InsO family protein